MVCVISGDVRLISGRDFGGFRLDGLANGDEQQRDEAAAPMAGSRVGGGGAGRAPACRVAHQHQEPPRHVRAPARGSGAEGPPSDSRHALPNGMYFMSQHFCGCSVFLYSLFYVGLVYSIV